MRSNELTIDVTEAVPLPGPLTVTVTVHRPDQLAAVETVAIGVPGGGYNRHYFDLRPDGHDGYSEAEFHTAHGWMVIACDPIGVGGSSIPPEPHTITQVAAVQAAVVDELRKRLSDGTLVDDLAPAPGARLIGLGHSMGGCFTVVAQGEHHCYDAVAVLGFGARHTRLPLPDGDFAAVGTDAAPDGSTTPSDYGRDAQEAVAAALMASFRWVFHFPDVPADIVDLDMATVPLRQGDDVPSWGMAAASLPCGVDMLTPGVVAAQAAAIRCPVLIAQGERDVVPLPREEPLAYASATDITVHVEPRMAHMHNFASTRLSLWQRIHAWGNAL